MANICGICGADYDRSLINHLRNQHGIDIYGLPQCVCGQRFHSRRNGILRESWDDFYDHLNSSQYCWMLFALRSE